MQVQEGIGMTDWQEQLSVKNRDSNARFSKELLEHLENECLTRKPRSRTKRKLMSQLGLHEKFAEVQHPSPGNTPPDIDKEEI